MISKSAYLKLLPGLILIGVMVFILVNMEFGSNILFMAALGFVLAIYALIGGRKFWEVDNKRNNLTPIIRMIFVILGSLAILYSFVGFVTLMIISV